MEQSAVAQEQFAAGRIAEARRTIEKAIAIRDDIVEIHLLQGRIEAAARAPANAFAAYSDALSLDAGNGEALLGVAHFGLESGHVQASEDATDRLLTLDPAQPDALLIKGIYNIMHNRGEDALANADAILAAAPGNETGTILKARALSMLGRPDESLRLMEQARKSTGTTVGMTRTLLELYRLKDDGPAMLAQLESLRRLLPNDREVVLDEANTLYKLGFAVRARDLLRGMILRPSTGDGNARLVTELWREYDATPLDAQTLSQIAARAGAPAKKAVARYYLAADDPARALAVLNGDTSDADVPALRAQAAIARGQAASGLGVADRILQTDKTNCDALLTRAEATLALRRYTDTIITSQVANANCPQVTRAYVLLARANEGARNDVAAELALRDGTNRNAQDSQLARLYTAWLERRGRGDRAIATARRLTAAAPALVSGWTLLSELCARNPAAGCQTEAQAGLAAAKRRFAVDRRADEPNRPGLFSRLEQNKDKDSFDAAAAARDRITSAPPPAAPSSSPLPTGP